jgi:hypothetical protein
MQAISLSSGRPTLSNLPLGKKTEARRSQVTNSYPGPKMAVPGFLSAHADVSQSPSMLTYELCRASRLQAAPSAPHTDCVRPLNSGVLPSSGGKVIECRYSSERAH